MPDSPEWLPDWTGETVAILASGPSAAAAARELHEIDTIRLISINCAWSIAPWSDILYACDGKWWRQPGQSYGQEALRSFLGLMVSNDKRTCEGGVVRWVDIARVNHLVTDGSAIGSGSNGGFQALNLAVLTGAKRILLCGYDMRGGHFHPPHPRPLDNPSDPTLRRFLSAFGNARSQLRELGVEVVNCTLGSSLTAFPIMPLHEALA